MLIWISFAVLIYCFFDGVRAFSRFVSSERNKNNGFVVNVILGLFVASFRGAIGVLAVVGAFYISNS